MRPEEPDIQRVLGEARSKIFRFALQLVMTKQSETFRVRAIVHEFTDNTKFSGRSREDLPQSHLILTVKSYNLVMKGFAKDVITE